MAHQPFPYFNLRQYDEADQTQRRLYHLYMETSHAESIITDIVTAVNKVELPSLFADDCVFILKHGCIALASNRTSKKWQLHMLAVAGSITASCNYTPIFGNAVPDEYMKLTVVNQRGEFWPFILANCGCEGSGA